MVLTHDPILDHRARIEHARLEAEQQRAEALTGQCAPENSPAVRVRIWEKLHQVYLPKSSTHGILRIVAKHTGLALEQVLEVQRQRLMPATP
jgi:hypothetical protein